MMTCAGCFKRVGRLYRFGDRFVCRRCEHSGMAELNKGDDDD